MTTTKRQNFNITPEQEAEIAHLKELVDAPTTKDAILSAVRFYATIAREVKEGREIYLSGSSQNQLERVLIPELEALKPPLYKYLVRRPHEWRQQLYVKGRRLTAASVFKDYFLEQRTLQQLAEDWDLPPGAIQECINYCQDNQALLQMEAEEEIHRLAQRGK
jgi:hypothetical protein